VQLSLKNMICYRGNKKNIPKSFFFMFEETLIF